MGMKIFIEIFCSLKKDSRTRGNEVTLVKDQCRLNIRKYSFSHGIVNFQCVIVKSTGIVSFC